MIAPSITIAYKRYILRLNIFSFEFPEGSMGKIHKSNHMSIAEVQWGYDYCYYAEKRSSP